MSVSSTTTSGAGGTTSQTTPLDSSSGGTATTTTDVSTTTSTALDQQVQGTDVSPSTAASVNDSTVLGSSSNNTTTTSTPSDVMPIQNLNMPTCNILFSGKRYHDDGEIGKLIVKIGWTGAKLGLWLFLSFGMAFVVVFSVLSRKRRKSPGAIVAYVLFGLLVLSVLIDVIRLSNYRSQLKQMKPSSTSCQYNGVVYEDGLPA